MSDGFKYIESKRVSKTQKRKDAKAAKKAEQLKRIEEGEKLDEHKDRRLEEERFDKILEEHRLCIYNIEADGDCLYAAVQHQLSLASDSDELLCSQELRERTSQYMLDNANDFLPFLVNDDGDLMNDDEYKAYCSNIAKTRQWGGHLELTAIAQMTKKEIHIFQAEGRQVPLIIETKTKTDKAPILLSFHKHLYRLGEHYNSLIKKQ